MDAIGQVKCVRASAERSLLRPATCDREVQPWKARGEQRQRVQEMAVALYWIQVADCHGHLVAVS